MNFHSLSVTGVIDSRLPGRSVTIFASGLWFLQFSQGNQTGLAQRAHVDVDPARIVLLRGRVVVVALLVELRLVGVGRGGDLGDAGDARLRAARVIEQHAVADLHLVAHEIARLVVAHAAPRRDASRRGEHVVDRALIGLALHQPVFHCSFWWEVVPRDAGGPGSRTLAITGWSLTGHIRFVRRAKQKRGTLTTVTLGPAT